MTKHRKSSDALNLGDLKTSKAKKVILMGWKISGELRSVIRDWSISPILSEYASSGIMSGGCVVYFVVCVLV